MKFESFYTGELFPLISKYQSTQGSVHKGCSLNFQDCCNRRAPSKNGFFWHKVYHASLSLTSPRYITKYFPHVLNHPPFPDACGLVLVEPEPLLPEPVLEAEVVRDGVHQVDLRARHPRGGVGQEGGEADEGHGLVLSWEEKVSTQNEILR